MTIKKMNLEIKFLSEIDTSDYRELRLQSYKEAPLAFSESYEDEKDKSLNEFKDELVVIGTPPEWFLLGAFLPNEGLIGFVKFRRDLRSKARHKSMIHAMYTNSKYRNHGVGKKLIQSLLKATKLIVGLEQIHLWVLHSEVSAANFYIKCGFISQGTLVKKDLKVGDTYVDAEYMVMYLNNL